MLVKLQCLVCGGLLEVSRMHNHYECRSCQMLYRYEGENLEIAIPKQVDTTKWWIIRNDYPPYTYRLGYGDRYVDSPEDLFHSIRNPGYATYAALPLSSTYGYLSIQTRFDNLEERYKRWLSQAMRELKPDLTLDEIEEFFSKEFFSRMQGGF